PTHLTPFYFHLTPSTGISTLSLHDALPISFPLGLAVAAIVCFPTLISHAAGPPPAALKTFLEREGFGGSPLQRRFGNHLFATTIDRKSTRLNSSHVKTSYAVFCLKKKNKKI